MRSSGMKILLASAAGLAASMGGLAQSAVVLNRTILDESTALRGFGGRNPYLEGRPSRSERRAKYKKNHTPAAGTSFRRSASKGRIGLTKPSMGLGTIMGVTIKTKNTAPKGPAQTNPVKYTSARQMRRMKCDSYDMKEQCHGR